MNKIVTVSLGAAVWLVAIAIQAQEAIRVTVDNFKRAESDNYFKKGVEDDAFGKFLHHRELTPIDQQPVIRMNRDTVYSQAVFDLDAGPVTITLPDAGKRFMSMQIINEDHYVAGVVYAPASHLLTKDEVGTRYVMAAIRTFVNPNDPADVKTVHALQDAIKVDQRAPGTFDIPKWDQDSLAKIRAALNALAAANGGIDSARMFGSKDQVDPVQHLLGTASAWGGNPSTAALYAGVTPDNNDGKTVYRLTVKDVPVDGFWSVSVYNKDGFFEKNTQNAYTLNNVTAKPNADGSVTIQFGGEGTNVLPITPGWNYLVRLYRPRAEILNGTWKFPEALPVK